MPQLGVPELIIILVIALIFFGPGRLPEVSEAIGRSIREFQRAVRGGETDSDDTDDVSDETRPPIDSESAGD